MVKKKIVLILFGFIFCSSMMRNKVQHSKNSLNELITNGKPTYWDPYITYDDHISGIGLYLISDSTLIEYEFDSEMRRKAYDYGDFMLDTIRWKRSNDTIYLGGDEGHYSIYKILKLKNDSLEVLDCKGNALRSQMLFVKSKDQNTPLLGKH